MLVLVAPAEQRCRRRLTRQSHVRGSLQKHFHVNVPAVEMKNVPWMKLTASGESDPSGVPSHTGPPLFRAKAMSSARVSSALAEGPPLFLTAGKRGDHVSRSRRSGAAH